jgi:hypothetical protein
MLRWMQRHLEVQYPLLENFDGVQEVCRCHLSRYPGFPPPFVGAAYFGLQYCDEDFENQDVWNEWRLRDQQDRSVHVDKEHWYEYTGWVCPSSGVTSKLESRSFML